MNAHAALHPTEQTLSSFALGKLDDASSEAVNEHLEQCPDCRKRAGAMSADSFLERVRGAQARPESRAGIASPVAGPSMVTGGPSSPALPPTSTLPPGLADHPDYEILRELGRGGMGVVYLAQNKLMGRPEVLKVVGGHLVERRGVRDRFLREVQSAAKLQHKNIVAAYSAIRLSESIVFAMEYVEGDDLAKVVKASGPLPVVHACYFIYQAALGLQHAHERGMVHRDIKPANLILAREGKKAVVKVLDFGLAKLTTESQAGSGLTREGQMLGTPEYIAPEQIRDAQSADIRADIYSLGCTFYYLLTGGPPFHGDSLWDLYQAHFSMDAGPLNLVRPEVPVELAALVAKMLAKEPGRRFQTPGEVSQALVPFFKPGANLVSKPGPEISRVGQAASSPQPVGRPAPAQPAIVATAPAAAPRGPSKSNRERVAWESLIELKETERSVNKAPEVEPTRQPPWKKRPIALAGSLFGLIALGVIIIIIRDKSGRETKIIVPDDSKVVVEGPPKNVEIKPPVNSPEEARGTGGPTPSSREAGKPSVDKPQGPPTDNVDASDFARLFNGKDLSGWTFPLHNQTDWTVENGSIRGSATEGGSTIATSRSDYKDFHLRMEVRTTDNLNKNLLIRASHSDGDVKYYVFWTGVLSPSDGIVYLGEYRIKRGGHKFDTSQVTTDGLREITAPKLPGLTKDTWQRVEIIAVGNEFKMLVDDREVSAFQDTESRLKRGQIAIRLLKGCHVEIHNIEIKELNGQGVARHEVRQRGFVSLFNGKDLTGWESLENGSRWKVENGVLEGRGGGFGKPAVLVSKRRDFKNFRLRVKVRYLDAESYGRIELRCTLTDGGSNGYFVSHGVWPTPIPHAPPFGCVAKAIDYHYGPGPIDWQGEPKPISCETDRWYTMEVSLTKNVLTTSVDGNKLSDYTDADETYKLGAIALVCSGDSGRVQFQEVMIEELPQ